MHRYIPEPVGSPAVLLVRVSNLPLRVVRSLLISIQVEGAFGVLKSDYEFQRFLLRGKTKVKLEILLLCLGYNLNKLHAKIQNGRTGSHLFEVKTA